MHSPLAADMRVTSAMSAVAVAIVYVQLWRDSYTSTCPRFFAAPECPQVSWPSKSTCPQCRLPVLQKKSDERGGSDGGRRTGESLSYGEEPIQWNDEEVYRFLMKWYGGKPGDGSIESAGGPFTILAGQSDEDNEVLGDDIGNASVGILSNSIMTTFVVVAVIAAILVLLLYRRQQRRRNVYGGVKGPGVVGLKGHYANGSKHTVRLDAEAWGGSRFPASLNRKAGFQ